MRLDRVFKLFINFFKYLYTESKYTNYHKEVNKFVVKLFGMFALRFNLGYCRDPGQAQKKSTFLV